MNSIEFYDHSEMNGICIDNGPLLIIKTTMPEATKHFADFSNPNKTKKIIEYTGEVYKNVYEGFTHFGGINVGNDGMYSFYLESVDSTYSHRRFFTVPREMVSDDMLSIAEFE